MSHWPKPTSPRSALAASLRIGAAYLAVAGAWILFSDRLPGLLHRGAVLSPWYQTGKGLAFVTVTASLLVLHCHRQFAALWRSQAGLRESQRQFAALVSNLPGMAYRMVGEEPRVLRFVSDGCRELTGYGPEELTDGGSIAYAGLIHPDDRGLVNKTMERAMRRREAYRLQYRLRHADGQERWVWEQGLPVFSEAGQLVALEGFVTDVTAQKRMEEALRASEVHHRRIVEGAEAGVWTVDLDGRTTFVNARMAAMLGYEPAEMIGRLMYDFFDEEGRRIAEANLQRRRDGISETHDFKLLRKDGEAVWTLMSCSPLLDRDGRHTGALAMVKDVTEQRRVELLESERRSLQETNRAMEDALGVIAHELRTPLAALRAMAEMLAAEEPLEADTRRQFHRSIHGESVRMSEMVNDMLEAARVRRGSASWNWSEVALETVCADALEIVRPMFSGGRVELAMEVEPGLTTWGDAAALRRLLLNLLSNAQRHTPQGRITLRAGREPGAVGQAIRLQVEDTGRGIAPEAMEKLGVAFALGRGAISPQAISGAGLGLAICNQIAAAHGGRINVASRPGRGATFLVRLRSDLPAAQDGEPQPILPETGDEGEAPLLRASA